MNQGYTSTEVAAMLTLPEKLEKVWYTRPYYGTLAHNAKAVYQKYLGWYDANPVNLNPLPPSDTAKKLVEYLGSTDAVLRKARKDFEKGDYQWVAQITKELVFADPSNQKARNLCADALEQLGYQAESGAWRNAYLMGAAELRKGNLSGLARTANGLGSAMKEMTVDMLLDYISILTDANAAQNDDVTLNLSRDGCEGKVLCDPKKRYSAVLFGREPPGRAGHGHLQAAAAPCPDAGAAGRSGAGKRRCHCPEASAGVCVQV